MFLITFKVDVIFTYANTNWLGAYVQENEFIEEEAILFLYLSGPSTHNKRIILNKYSGFRLITPLTSLFTKISGEL